MYNPNNTATIIKNTAKEKGVSIGQMLMACGLNKDAISLMVRRNSWLQSNNLAKIADYLDCSVDYLLGRIDNPSIKTNDENERKILDIYRNLNPAGQEQFMTQATILSNVVEYKKSPAVQQDVG